MSKLIYDINVSEEFVDKKGSTLRSWDTDLPHADKILEFISKEYQKDAEAIKNSFTGEIKNKVKSTTMRCFVDRNKSLVARITTEFVEDFRLSEKRRMSFWRQMDAQMTDGFGESIDHAQIPHVAKGYRICL